MHRMADYDDRYARPPYGFPLAVMRQGFIFATFGVMYGMTLSMLTLNFVRPEISQPYTLAAYLGIYIIFRVWLRLLEKRNITSR